MEDESIIIRNESPHLKSPLTFRVDNSDLEMIERIVFLVTDPPHPAEILEGAN